MPGDTRQFWPCRAGALEFATIFFAEIAASRTQSPSCFGHSGAVSADVVKEGGWPAWCISQASGAWRLPLSASSAGLRVDKAQGKIARYLQAVGNGPPHAK